MIGSEVDVRALVVCPPATVRRVRALARRYIDELRLGPSALSVVLVSDRAIRKLNRHWRKIDKATDVLSFGAGDGPSPPGEPRPLGDVVISLQTARRVAREESRPVNAQLAIYLAHGVLHLLGHDHHQPTETRRMARAEERLLGASGLVSLALDSVPKRSPTLRSARARRSRS